MSKKLLLLFSLISSIVYLFYSYQQTQIIFLRLQSDLYIASTYQKKGIDTLEFRRQGDKLKETISKNTFLATPFMFSSYESSRLANINTLTIQYKIALGMARDTLNSKLNFFRDRLKENTVLTNEEKSGYFFKAETIAGFAFERTSSIAEIATSEALLEDLSAQATSYADSKTRGILFTDLQRYIVQCEALKTFFSQRQYAGYSEEASSCIQQGKSLFKPDTQLSDLEAQIHDLVYQKSSELQNIRLQIEQEETLRALSAKQMQDALQIVPPAPIPVGKIVVINLELQRLYAYENTQPIFKQPVLITTGKNGFETIRGEFTVYDKKRNFRMLSPFPNEYYDSVVDFWMPFFLGYGLHNAPWRSVYGTQDYKSVGSHGCVNIPYTETEVLYNWVEVGTKVIVL